MARYSRMDLIDWWNDALEHMRWTGEFRRLCEQADRDHGESDQTDTQESLELSHLLSLCLLSAKTF